MEPDLVLADIITTDLEIDPSRVVVYDQNYMPPSDNDLYVIIITRSTSTISSSTNYDYDTNEEIKSVTSVIDIDVELTSKTREALERKEEILMAIKSTYSQNMQEENSMKIQRAGDILDLSFIEAASAMHRFRVPVRIFYLKTKRKTIVPYEQFIETEVANG